MELPNLISAVLFYQGAKSQSLMNGFLLSLFLIHYINRAIIYPFRTRSVSDVRLIVFLLAFGWTLYNGLMQGSYLGNHATFPDGWMYDYRFLFGVALFCWGLYTNVQSDEILMNLRKPGDTGYYIPKGGMFEYVTAANYFGEFVEWVGFAIACQSWCGAAFAVFTWANLFPRAVTTHGWYHKKFDTYPKKRKAFFPFLY